jgi:uncharacterized cupin superfamily protein
MAALQPIDGSCTDVVPTYDRPRPERLVKGDPLRTTWEFYAPPGGGISCGIWACEAGAWRIAFDEHSDEYFHVLAGRIRITDAEGCVREFGPGDACVIPAGFSGVFEVVEPVQKHYVMVKRQG